jgi:hypothetical protein
MSLTVMHSSLGVEARDSPLKYAERMQEVAPPNNGLVLTVRSPSLRSRQRPAAQAETVGRQGAPRHQPATAVASRTQFV